VNAGGIHEAEPAKIDDDVGEPHVDQLLDGRLDAPRNGEIELADQPHDDAIAVRLHRQHEIRLLWDVRHWTSG